MKVRVGTSFRASGGELFNVSEIIQHPKYNSWNIDYDFSLLRLETELKFSDSVQPIKIPCLGENFPDGTIVCKFITGN